MTRGPRYIQRDAFEHGKIDRNPARGKRRRLKAEERSRPWVEPEQLLALLDAADSHARPIFATLAGTGMRPGEALALQWGDVNLATSTIRIRESKTSAGVRQVDVPMGTAETLRELKARSNAARSDPVFSDSQGRRQTKRNIQQRLKKAIKGANNVLADAGIEPLSEEITPYAFRRTYSSLRASRWIDAEGTMRPGDDPVYIAEQMGHTDPKFTVRVYQRAVKRRERLSGAHLEAFDKALQWAAMGRIPPEPVVPSLSNVSSIQGMPG